MTSWLGSADRTVSSRRELKDVDMFIYTDPAGLLGRILGRCLRFRVSDFSFVVDRRQPTVLRRVEVDADSIRGECEVYAPSRNRRHARFSSTGSSGADGAADSTRFERLPLTYSEIERLRRRVRGSVLNVPRYPLIEFEVASETPSAIEGVLSLHGESKNIKCSRQVEGGQLVVQCPISLKDFHIIPYSLWFGLFSVADKVIVETRVPASVLKL